MAKEKKAGTAGKADIGAKMAAAAGSAASSPSGSPAGSAGASLGNVLILGYGVTGRAVSEYLEAFAAERTASVTVVESDNAENVGILDTQKFDLCIASPGISQFSDLYTRAAAASDQIISEVEFAWRESRPDALWVAVTGTNGKTTTTSLITHILVAAGFNAVSVGNIGDACIAAIGKMRDAADAPVFVAETSSYQLASTVDFAPNVAVVLNITPDHLNWHKSHRNYAEAKWKAIQNLDSTPDSTAVLNAVDDEVRARVREIRQIPEDERGFAYIPLGTADGINGDMRAKCGAANAAYCSENGHFIVAFKGVEHDLGAISKMRLKGAHNIENVMAAASAAVALGADDSAIELAISTFEALEHRIEPAGVIGGVSCFNDSKATNIDATLKALEAFKPEKPIILLGGRDKGTDLSELVESCACNAKAAVCFGEAADRFYDALSDCTGKAPYALEKAANMEAALDAALRLAQAGDIVLLSPACASFDEFSCFEERGRVFKQLVAARAKMAGVKTQQTK